jgi:hypothetical protein
MGLEDTPGVPAPPERMQAVTHSDFGSSFYVAERLHDGRNLRIRRQSLNWNPENFLHALKLISMSINNVINFLKIANGVAGSDVEWLHPDDESYFEEPWAQSEGSVFAMSMNSPIKESFIKPVSKEQILAVYARDSEKTDTANNESESGHNKE